MNYDRAVNEKALELTKGMPGMYNIWPVIDLIQKAWSMGYDVVLKPPAPTPPE